MGNKILLPAIKGIIGDWIFYQTVIPFKEVINRIDNDHSIREYKSLDDHLQRDLSKRSKKIAAYLARENARFFNAVIIGIFGGNPNWYNFSFAPSPVPEMQVDDYILNTIGILELSGEEKLFSIDGQHRIEGIKQAISENAEKFINDELSVIIVAHRDTPEGKVRTRRLFSEINTKAVRVSGLDDLITNENNPIYINARKLYANFEPFKKNKFIALKSVTGITIKDKEFTTILCIKDVNQILYDGIFNFNEIRPSDDIIESLYQISSKFWEDAINNIPSYRVVMVDLKKDISEFRNKDGGSMLFRPIGIEILARSYTNWKSEKGNTDDFWEIFNKVAPELDGIHWNNILWNNAKKTIAGKISPTFTREYTKYLLGLTHDENYVAVEYSKIRGGENISILPLPERVF